MIDVPEFRLKEYVEYMSFMQKSAIMVTNYLRTEIENKNFIDEVDEVL